MKKVITMVGTSLFENYMEKHDNTNFEIAYKYLKENKIKANKMDDVDYINTLKGKLNNQYFKNNINASAEIKSLTILKKQLKENFDIYLLHSDTALSRLAAEILKEKLNLYDELQNSNIIIKKIEGLQIWDKKEFEEGRANLTNEIYNIAQGYWGNIVINITGGYKATIPYLTILAQINECPIYYSFEETDALIEIPHFAPVKIEINWELFGRYLEIFEKIEHPKSLLKNEVDEQFLGECITIINEEEIDNQFYISLSPIGEIFWRKYKEKYFIFYAPENVYREIETQKNIKQILTQKFWRNEQRKNKTEIKNGHQVYDDGNNPYRIFYFEEDNEIYIYKTFENHNEYERYLEKTKIDDDFKKKIKEQSKIYKEEVQR